MRRLRAGGVAAALLLGLAATATAQPGTYRTGDGLIGGLFAEHKPGTKTDAKPADKVGEKPGDKAPDKAADKAGDKAADKAAPPGPSPAAARATLEREEKALLRRQKVCDQLRQVALDTGNTELEQQADQLSQRAFPVFEERTAGLAAVAAEDKGPARPGAGRTLPLAHRTGDDRPAREDQ
jgi:hypothetical protein